MKLLSDKKLEFLIDESFYYEDIHFYGTPWIQPITFQEGRWAFERNFDEEPIEIPNCDVLLTHDNPFENEHIRVSNTTAPYHLFGHWHDGEEDVLRCRFNCSLLDDMYNHKKKFKGVIIDIMTKKDIITDVMEYFMKNELFMCPKDNNIQEHNKKIFDLFKQYLDEKEPIEEFLESSIITDFNE